MQSIANAVKFEEGTPWGLENVPTFAINCIHRIIGGLVTFNIAKKKGGWVPFKDVSTPNKKMYGIYPLNLSNNNWLTGTSHFLNYSQGLEEFNSLKRKFLFVKLARSDLETNTCWNYCHRRIHNVHSIFNNVGCTEVSIGFSCRKNWMQRQTFFLKK